MSRKQIFEWIKARKSFLCVGLDPDPARVPAHLGSGPAAIYRFNQGIIDATRDLCVAYKPNTAFYEAMGPEGWEVLRASLAYIGDEHLKIADAKRGDIGNTSRMYAKTFFETMAADAITVAPYMGEDSVKPFLGFAEKWVILLALTSNSGSNDFQLTTQGDTSQPLYAKVMETAQRWASPEQLMFVCGATHPQKFRELRQLAPDNFFLVPGIGAQGGDLAAVARHGMNDHCGLLVNSSRGIIYAGSGEDFADQARSAAQSLQQQMVKALATYLP
ncbi:MAG: orotidine-5'-phosphate decarboxylase [Bacteroidetes bacterium]|nr:MAG: orotidine-5'-phosphate decarboxylase [Bacteroidota bacterium]